jgi:hypothetical protein
MLPILRARAIARIASSIRGVVPVIVLAACSQHGTGMHDPSRAPDCRVDLLESHPGTAYTEVGQLSLEVYAAGPSAYQYKNARALLAEIRAEICAVGGDTLMTERNAAGVIVRGTVFRRSNELEPFPRPPQRPSRSEICEPSCGPGFTCEGGTCIQLCVPECADGETCGADQLCHPNQ